MHHANHFYGHAHIMARYVGLEEPPRIWGYLQHGWNMHDGFAVGTVFAPLYRKFVWSEACAKRGWAAGVRDYVVVAAPWLYLLELERQHDWLAAAPERKGTIVYPFHGWEGQQVLGSHKAYIEEILATEGDEPITVCLHWNEFDEPKVREEYENAGVRVITHGQRGYLWQDTDVAFLYRQLNEMRNHRRVVSNRMTSAILYGAAAGNEVGIYGDPMALESDHAVLGGVAKPRRLWPEMHQVAVPADYATAVALEELGADEFLLPAEVIDVFRWGPEIARPLPPPPAPPLEDESFWKRRSSASRRQDSHRSPADAERMIEGLPAWLTAVERPAPEVGSATADGDSSLELGDDIDEITDAAGPAHAPAGDDSVGGTTPSSSSSSPTPEVQVTEAAAGATDRGDQGL